MSDCVNPLVCIDPVKEQRAGDLGLLHADSGRTVCFTVAQIAVSTHHDRTGGTGVVPHTSSSRVGTTCVLHLHGADRRRRGG